MMIFDCISEDKNFINKKTHEIDYKIATKQQNKSSSTCHTTNTKQRLHTFFTYCLILGCISPSTINKYDSDNQTVVHIFKCES